MVSEIITAIVKIFDVWFTDALFSVSIVLGTGINAVGAAVVLILILKHFGYIKTDELEKKAKEFIRSIENTFGLNKNEKT